MEASEESLIAIREALTDDWADGVPMTAAIDKAVQRAYLLGRSDSEGRPPHSLTYRKTAREIAELFNKLEGKGYDIRTEANCRVQLWNDEGSVIEVRFKNETDGWILEETL